MQEASKLLGHAAIETPGGGSLIAALAILPIGNFATVFSTVYWQLVFGKIFVGIGTGTCFIGGVRYLASYFSGERLPVLQGNYGGWLTGGNYRLSFTALEIFSLAPGAASFRIHVL